MKIGIITFCTPKQANYGQILQCFALQSFLKKLGHKPFLIRYKVTRDNTEDQNNKKSPLRFLFHFPTYIKLFEQIIKSHKFNDEERKHNRNFQDFIDKHISSSSIFYDSLSLYDTPPIADAFICGSDQIWGGDTAYYLDFVSKGKTKIAYAPSFGGINSFSSAYEKKISLLLKDFSFIGMRETSGVETCRRLGRSDTIQVADPTLLLSKSDYDSIRINSNINDNYLFLYLIGNPTDVKLSEVYKLAKRKGLRVIYVAAQMQYDKREKTYPQIGEWIDYIARSQFVITNSYHGTIFSLIYNKPFITIPLVDEYKRMNTRIEELLRNCKLENRILQTSLSHYVETLIDFTPFNEYKKNCSLFAKNLFQNLL